MFDFDYFKSLLLISIFLSTINCIFIQKTKSLFKNSKIIIYYSLIVNIVVGIFFAQSFTAIKFPNSIWLGLFSFIGADSIFKSLEGKISSYSDIINRNKST